MVRYCIDHMLPLGVCDTEKVVHTNERHQTLQEALNSNQNTYKPRRIFSAGPVRLLEELDDGRLLISVETDRRLILGKEKQTLPFTIWTCEELLDEPPHPDAHRAMAQCQEKILHRLITITHHQPTVQSFLRDDHWRTMHPQPFSFAIAGHIGMDPSLAQHLLETTDTQQRLDSLLQLLNNVH